MKVYYDIIDFFFHVKIHSISSFPHVFLYYIYILSFFISVILSFVISFAFLYKFSFFFPFSQRYIQLLGKERVEKGRGEGGRVKNKGGENEV